MLIDMAVRAEAKQRTRAALLAAASDLIRENGFGGTTARQIATTAGVAVGTVFVHFPTMHALAETLLDETVGRALDTVRPDPEGSAVDQLVAVCATLYDAYDEDPALSREVLAGSLLHRTPDGPADTRMGQFAGWVQQIVADGVLRGELAPVAPDEAFALFFVLYVGLLLAGLRGEIDRPHQLALLRTGLTRLLGATERNT